MPDAFTLLLQAADLLPDDARTPDGGTPSDIRDCARGHDWEFVFDLLLAMGRTRSLPPGYWALLADAAEQAGRERAARWCGWRRGEAERGGLRAELVPTGPGEGPRRTPFDGDGRLRPMWDIGLRTPDGGLRLAVAALWVEDRPLLAPGASATVRLAPLTPELWHSVTVGQSLTMYETREPGGRARVIGVVPPFGGG
ncbi:hypothetical protein [Kitasatospora sp. NPDC085879]|uniref:hypothetical protein n=1 Tax=Kitasatospora sp. NPDC085879 TaxID=3154769 RepID=UPI0034481B97